MSLHADIKDQRPGRPSVRIKTVVIVRSAQAASDFPNHRIHPLTVAGRRQAEERRRKLGDVSYDFIFHSPLSRGRETAAIVAEPDSADETIVVSSLYPPDEDPRVQMMERLLDELGYVPLREYFAHGGEDAIMGIAREAHAAIAGALQSREWTDALIVGHGPLVPALGAAFCGQPNFVDMAFGECEGIRLRLSNDGAKIMAWESI
ncbi:MAG: histidine phosphatase family protein [Patescibacteria group bacterium]|nr:histidine phosphatase family protein [Patescibacteria group bacterium]